MIFLQIATSYSIEEYTIELYHELLGNSSYLVSTARSFAALLAMFYVAYKLYRPLAMGEPIDLLPVFRPFIIGMVLIVYPACVSALSGILDEANTKILWAMSGTFEEAEAMKAKRDKLMEEAYQKKIKEIEAEYTNNSEDSWDISNIASSISSSFELAYEKMLLEGSRLIGYFIEKCIEIIALAARIAIMTLRTFTLTVLAIVGPIAIALSVFEPFSNNVWTWLSRFIQVHLWLPIANIFSLINAKLLLKSFQYDILQLREGNYADSVDLLYCCMMLIGVFGYMSIPTVSGWVIEAAGGTGSFTGSQTKGFNAASKMAGGAAANLAKKVIGK